MIPEGGDVRLRFGDCVLDRPARELRRGGVPRELSPKGLTLHGRGYRFRWTATVEPPPDAPSPAGCRLLWGDRQIPLLEGMNVLGRGAEATIRIDLGRVSRLHARIRVEGERVLLEDLGSKNGTFLRGERVVAPAELADGDEIAIGSVVLLFRAGGSDATTETGTIR